MTCRACGHERGDHGEGSHRDRYCLIWGCKCARFTLSAPLPSVDAYSDIQEERRRQDERFGDQSRHNSIEWASILSEECGEVVKEANDLYWTNKGCRVNLRDELVQVAAVAVAFIEALDKRKQ